MPADAANWDRRYAEATRVWRAEPHEEVVAAVAGLTPGRALDVASGEGRHAIWLAENGWQVTAIDFSAVGLDKGRDEAARRGLDIEWVVDDVTTWTPEQRYDLVLVAFLHIGTEVYDRLRGYLAPGGHLLVVGHARRNVTEGVGGPQDPAMLDSPETLRLAAGDLQVLRLEEVLRPTPAGNAIDIVLDARRD
ncbi:Methyltransferase domain-containing protein [Raineyella antarctica]|uniref:Methyltransferase domain-containing protein n=1 Tax=Raineyella antarctica TaxID=1577474 RepID=A0A1G6GDU6_9ACTN|nr:class I SAM-dependent methyltransferase [Raineyella antarctica]SDB80178.1 Methyltransferase domain-containing protein [Raineyella antarctica]